MFPVSRLSLKRTAASDGFVLVELIVAMIASVVVCGLIVLMLQVSLGEAARVTDTANANLRGRLALETIIGELHNSCVASRVAPVEAGSDANRLLVVSSSGSGEAATLHEIALSRGTLSDTSYANTGSRPAPEWEFAKTGTTKTLATGISAAGTTPVFQYYAYSSSSELQSTPLPAPLTDSSAAEASAVTVTFTATPHSSPSDAGRGSVLADTALLRLASATPGESGPCA